MIFKLYDVDQLISVYTENDNNGGIENSLGLLLPRGAPSSVHYGCIGAQQRVPIFRPVGTPIRGSVP